jgi:hypothetical protein
MRYLLIVVGLLCVLVGLWAFEFAPLGGGPFAPLFVELGVILLAAGLATVDIVEAIKAKRQ